MRSSPAVCPLYHAPHRQAVLELVVSHQGRPLKLDLLRRLLATLVLPAPERYRDYLRRLAALPAKGTADVALRAQQLLEHSLLADLRAVVARVGGGWRGERQRACVLLVWCVQCLCWARVLPCWAGSHVPINLSMLQPSATGATATGLGITHSCLFT